MKAAYKLHLSTWLLCAIAVILFCGGPAQGQWDDPNVFAEGFPVGPHDRKVMSCMNPLAHDWQYIVPPGAVITGVEVRFNVSDGSVSLCNNYVGSGGCERSYYMGYFDGEGHEQIPEFFDGGTILGYWCLILEGTNVTIYSWSISVYYQVPPCDISVSPLSHNFGIHVVGMESDPLEINMSNIGGGYLQISDIELTDVNNFTLDVNGGSHPAGSKSPTIRAGSSRTVTVTFNPTIKGTFDTNLTIISDDPDNPTESVSLTGSSREARTIYVDTSVDGANDGSSWADAKNFLQDALADAIAGDQILVAKGIYNPDANTMNPEGTGNREATFQLINGVALKGGYAGFGEPDPNARDIDAYQTVLSGDLDGNDVDVVDPCNLQTETTRAENSYQVLACRNCNQTTVLDGFKITGACHSGISNFESSPTVTSCIFFGNSSECGGGMCNVSNSSPTVTNCTFTGNSSEYGGGMYNFSNSSPTVTDCTFSGNKASCAGGMRNYSSSPTVTNCTFSGNSSEYGGSMFNDQSNPTVVSCSFYQNSALWGGGVFNFFCSESTLTNCIFRENSASDIAGAIYNDSYSVLNLSNCVFIVNSAGDAASGIYNYDTSSTILANCTFVGNSANNGNALACDSYQQAHPSNVQVINCIFWDGGNEIWNNDISTITVTYSNIQGGWFGTGNIDVDPCFVDVNNPDPNLWNLRLMTDSPCIDAGDNGAAKLPPIDISDNPRIVDGDCNSVATVDMGAYEFALAYLGDFDNNCSVNFFDVSILARAWMTEEGDSGWDWVCDISNPPDDYIDWRDVAVLCENWLTSIGQ